jgi:hypothetical protein
LRYLILPSLRLYPLPVDSVFRKKIDPSGLSGFSGLKKIERA